MQIGNKENTKENKVTMKNELGIKEMFIEFEVYKGKVCVNVNLIESIYVYNQLTYIRSSSGGEVATTEPYESVVKKIMEFSKEQNG